MRTDLVLNVIPIRFEDGPVDVGVLAYESESQLKSLRDRHNKTHVFKRDRSSILCVAVAPNAPRIGKGADGDRKPRLGENLSLVARLASNAILTNVHDSGRMALGFRPIKIIAYEAANNLLARALPREVDCPEWISVRPMYEAEIRVVRLDRQPAFVGMSIDVRTTRFITASCAELLEQGMDLTGLYVGRKAVQTDHRVEPRLELLGRVQSISRDVITLIDARPGRHTVAAAEAVLELRNDAFVRCLSHAFGSSAQRVRESLEYYLGRFRNGPTRLQYLRRAVEHFASQELELVPGVAFSFGEFLSERRRSLPPIQTAPAPVYVFDPSGTRTKTWHDGGLDLYGPYSGRTFSPTRPRVCVICQRTKKGRVEQFVNKLLRGIQPTGQGRAPFAKGLLRKYELEDFSPEFFPADDDSVASYRKAIREALEHHGEQGPKWNLALIQIDDDFHQLPGPDNPYLVAKAAFLKHQIPTQEFTIETVDIPNRRLGYVLNNLALASYAKLGGTPWLIRADPAMAHELVIGMGSARIGEGRLGESEQVVGITTVFTGDGHYCVTNVSKVVPISDYKLTFRRSPQQFPGISVAGPETGGQPGCSEPRTGAC